MSDPLLHHVLQSIRKHCFKSGNSYRLISGGLVAKETSSKLIQQVRSAPSSRNVVQYLELALHPASLDLEKFVSSGSVPCWSSSLAPGTALTWQLYCSVHAGFCQS